VEYGDPALAVKNNGSGKLAQKPETPYTKKAPRQTCKQITSVEPVSSGLVAGLFYTGNNKEY
jgi:hypothetical protein